MSNSNDNKTGFGLSQFQRNRYFYGKLMTVKDFDLEQGYMNEKRHLLNRLVSGAGIICGLAPKDLEVSNAGGNIKIKFVTGGAAIDGWGREIVIPIDDNPRDIWVKQGDTQSNLTLTDLESAQYYLYLEYDPREGEMVSSASENSSCDETCCPSRIIENFQVIASAAAPETLTIACSTFSGASTEDAARQKVKKWLVDQTSKLCGVPVESKIFFLALKNGNSSFIDEQKSAQYITFVTNNRALSELLACHISDFYNPHKTSAAQVGALTSVDGVGNPGGNVDLVAQNSISITPNDTDNTITIGETHSSVTGNPHGTDHAQLSGILGARPSVPDQDKHIAAQDAVKWDNAVYKVGGAQPNAAGEILIKAGSNIVISTVGNEITITAIQATPPPLTKTGSAVIKTDESGSGRILVDPELDNSDYCVIVGVDHNEFVQFQDTEYAGLPVRFEVQVFRMDPEEQKNNKFLIYILEGGPVESNVPIRWWAIPGEFASTPTFTLPTFTFTTPTLTFTTPTLTFTTPTLTFTTPTLTFTTPTLTLTTPTLTLTTPTLTFTTPTLTYTAPTLTLTTPTLTYTRPTLTITEPTLTPTYTINPTVTMPTMPTIITPGLGYLTDIAGIGTVTADKLTAGGITTIAELAAASPEQVAEILGYTSTTKATTFINEAKSLMGKK